MREDHDAVIIETPLMGMWYLQNYHLYQRYHKKTVLVGHGPLSFLTPPRQLMHQDIDLNSFVNIFQADEIQESRAKYIVVHIDPMEECYHIKNAYPGYNRFLERIDGSRDWLTSAHGVPAREEAKKMVKMLRRTVGTPFYEDRWISVFKLR
jgi:hypothetical protein